MISNPPPPFIPFSSLVTTAVPYCKVLKTNLYFEFMKSIWIGGQDRTESFT